MPQLLFAPYPTDLRPSMNFANAIYQRDAAMLTADTITTVAPENLCDGECYIEIAWPDGYSEVSTCLGCLGCAGDDQPPF